MPYGIGHNLAKGYKDLLKGPKLYALGMAQCNPVFNFGGGYKADPDGVELAEMVSDVALVDRPCGFDVV